MVKIVFQSILAGAGVVILALAVFQGLQNLFLPDKVSSHVPDPLHDTYSEGERACAFTVGVDIAPGGVVPECALPQLPDHSRLRVGATAGTVLPVDAGGLKPNEWEELWKLLPDSLRPRAADEVDYFLCIKISDWREIARYGSPFSSGRGAATQRVFSLSLLRVSDNQYMDGMDICGSSAAPESVMCGAGKSCNWKSPLPTEGIIQYLTSTLH